MQVFETKSYSELTLQAVNVWGYIHTRELLDTVFHHFLLQEAFITFGNKALSGKKEEDSTQSLGGKLLTAAAVVGVAAVAGFFAMHGT